MFSKREADQGRGPLAELSKGLLSFFVGFASKAFPSLSLSLSLKAGMVYG